MEKNLPLYNNNNNNTVMTAKNNHKNNDDNHLKLHFDCFLYVFCVCYY